MKTTSFKFSGIIALIAIIGFVVIACDNGSSHTHTPGATATCTTAQVCTDCGDVIVAALGHDMEWVETIPATYISAGIESYTCIRIDCDHIEGTQPIPQIPITNTSWFSTSGVRNNVPDTDKNNPYTLIVNLPVGVNLNNTNAISNELRDYRNASKFVILDMSGSEFTAIGDQAFQLNTLIGITIPATVTSIGNSVFASSMNLTSVTVLATTPPILGNDSSFYYTPANLKIYVPAASVSAYKTAQYWATHADKIEAIP